MRLLPKQTTTRAAGRLTPPPARRGDRRDRGPCPRCVRASREEGRGAVPPSRSTCASSSVNGRRRPPDEGRPEFERRRDQFREDPGLRPRCWRSTRKKRGPLPVRRRGDDDLVEGLVTRRRRARPCSGGDGRQAFAERHPGSTWASTGKLADPARDNRAAPLERSGAVPRGSSTCAASRSAATYACFSTWSLRQPGATRLRNAHLHVRPAR